jgi:N-glycosylase/DNA lyase
MTPSLPATRRFFAARDYNLAATLDSGQAFRWSADAAGRWIGVIGARWVRLTSQTDGILAETAPGCDDDGWLSHYLQTGVDLDAVLRSFPDDGPMRDAAAACRGLRLLRQEPWECLASFILSSTKQIVQIRQMCDLLAARFGETISTADDPRGAKAFPTASRIAALDEAELRACKLGFRAPYLLAAARAVASGELALDRLGGLPCDAARKQLMHLPGVGRKIADCVLLFAYGFQEAFPVDVWVWRALKELYFPKRRVTAKRLAAFSASHFGPNSGWAQQYLFHYMRTVRPRPPRRVRRRTRARRAKASTQRHKAANVKTAKAAAMMGTNR